ncbi:hypothetical protein BN1723_015428 [Verticillium longisporum]|uniref:Uncharacterized protein n=1 Tax=Verticillium longisporum TaxID=100787 RepID=A0A0G4KMU1_VERLO|nr:hypothetical protein BN1708_009884 [Verticillium longisporum]CRK38876.1 hypothetical protein BN1723_015428 [Verticillium longisporum]
MTSATWPAPDLDDLAQAPEPLARAILLALCDDERVEARALRYYERLLQFEADAAQGAGNGAGTPAGGDEVRSPTESNPKKRKKKTGDPRICVQCDCVFVEEENGYESCQYHAGIIELFDETKVDLDWEEYSLEHLDTPSNRAMFPEAFRWICCRVTANEPGCKRGRHEANPDRSLKGRGSESRESSLDGDPLRLDAPRSGELTANEGGPKPEEASRQLELRKLGLRQGPR